MSDFHARSGENHACLAVRDAVNLDEAIETVANHAMRLARCPANGCRAKTFDPVRQKGCGHAVALCGNHQRSVKLEPNRICWSL